MNLAKLDKFYIALTIVLVLMAALVVFTFRTIFSAYNSASEFSQKNLSSDLAIDKEELEKADSWVKNKSIVPLEIR